MAATGTEALGSMGTDTPIAVLSDRPRLLFDYFSQLFAQVTNPPLDAIREELVTSVAGTVGPERNLLDVSAEHCRQIVLPFPVIDNDELAKIVHIDADGDDEPGYGDRRGVGTVRRGRRRRGDEAAAGDDLQGGLRRDPAGRAVRRALRPGLHRSTRRPSRRCCSPRPSTITSSARRPAPRWASSSRPGTSAKCTTWRFWSGTAPPRSTPTWRWRPSRTWCGPRPSVG